MKEIKFDEYVGNVIKTHREKIRLSLVDASSDLGMSNQRLSNYEFGKRSMSIVEFKKICDYYGLDYAEIIEEAYEKTLGG